MVRTDDKTGMTTYTLMGTLAGCDPYAKERSTGDNDVQKFYNFLLDLEEKVVQAAVENSSKWFGKKRSEEAIRDGFNRTIGTSKDNVDGEWVPNGKYPPSFKTKVPVYDGKVSTEIVDNRRNPVYATPDTLPSIFRKGVDCNLVVSGTIYVIAGGGFGITWRLNTTQVFAKSRVTAADIFAVEDDAEVDEPSKTVVDTADTEVERPETPTDQPVQPVATAPARKRRQAAGGAGTA